MRLHVLVREQRLHVRHDKVFPFFADAHNLERITPPWLSCRVVTHRPVAMHEGALIDHRLRLHGVPLRWRTRIAVWDPPVRFVDVQLRGPYAVWHHTHEFEPEGDVTLVRDVVRYGLPLGALGELAHTALVRRDLRRIFDFRRDRVEGVLAPRPGENPSQTKVLGG